MSRGQVVQPKVRRGPGVQLQVGRGPGVQLQVGRGPGVQLQVGRGWGVQTYWARVYSTTSGRQGQGVKAQDSRGRRPRLGRGASGVQHQVGKDQGVQPLMGKCLSLRREGV